LLNIEKLVAEKQKELESYQTKISSQEDLHQSRQDELENIRTKLLNIEKLVAEKQKELESYQAKISWKQYLHQSRKDGLENMRTKLLNLQTQYKVLHMQTDSNRKLLDETRQRHSMDDLEVEHDKLESEIESKRGEIADLKKQKQSAIQQTEQITQKISEQQKQLTDHTDILSSHLEMLEKQKTVILEEIAQAQTKKQAQEDELHALTKERLGLVSKNKDKQGMDEQIQKYRDRLHVIQNERSMLELEIKSQMTLLDEERQKEKKIMANILQKYN
jgi:chromosome segregation ATPase